MCLVCLRGDGSLGVGLDVAVAVLHLVLALLFRLNLQLTQTATFALVFFPGERHANRAKPRRHDDPRHPFRRDDAARSGGAGGYRLRGQLGMLRRNRTPRRQNPPAIASACRICDRVFSKAT